MSVNPALNRYTKGEMTKAEHTLLCAVADLLLMIEPRGYVEGTDIGKARARLERARVSLEAEGLMGRVTLTPEAVHVDPPYRHDDGPGLGPFLGGTNLS